MVKTGLTDTIYAGNRRVLTFTIEDQDAGDGSAKDITGFTVKFALARTDANGEPITSSPLIDLSSSGSQVVITDAANGVVQVTLGGSDTDSIVPGDYYFELEVFDSSSNSTVVAVGTMTIEPNVDNA